MPYLPKQPRGIVVVKATPERKKPTLSAEMIQRILRRVPYQEGFRFSRGIGDYTGQVATSLEDFAEMLQAVDLKSIEFHMQRQDFEKWIRNVFGDEELAKRVSRRMVFQGENRRKELVTLITMHLGDLKKMLQPK
jgi:hypothetical protein